MILQAIRQKLSALAAEEALSGLPPARPATVTKISPAADSWQTGWSGWREQDYAFGRGSREQQRRSSAQGGCTNLRTLLSSESLSEVWEAILGATSGPEHVIESWTELLRLN